MTIESDIASIKIHLGRIADALEGLLSERGYVPESATTVELDDDDEPVRTTKKKKDKRKKTTVGKTDKKKGDTELTDKDVRAELKILQETINQAAVKSLLKQYGASTLGQLSEKKYQRVIDDAKAQVEDA